MSERQSDEEWRPAETSSPPDSRRKSGLLSMLNQYAGAVSVLVALGGAVLWMDERFDQSEEQIQKTSGQIGNIRSQIGNIQGELVEIKRDLQQVSSKVAGIEGELKGVNGRISDVNQQVASISPWNLANPKFIEWGVQINAIAAAIEKENMDFQGFRQAYMEATKHHRPEPGAASRPLE